MSFPRIAHIVGDLNGYGGTEATLLRYIKQSRIPCEQHRVIVLRSIGEKNSFGAEMVAAGIYVRALGQSRGLMTPTAMVCLYRELRDFGPDIISGWLYHPSILASMLVPLLGRRPVVAWHIRCLTFSSLRKTPGRFIAQRILTVLSGLTDPVLVSNSKTAALDHGAIGFGRDLNRWTVIPNGLDVSGYFLCREDAIEVRRALGIPVDAILIGCVGRFAPEKGYSIMFRALAIAQQKLSVEMAAKLHFLAVGNNVTHDHLAFSALASTANLPWENMHLLGKRADVPQLLRALDLFVLPSIYEAFPNALVEAMATGLPCISTDVGECREVLANPVAIVEPNNACQLADGICAMIELSEQERRILGDANRRRITDSYGLKMMVDRFDSLFEVAATTRPSSRRP